MKKGILLLIGFGIILYLIDWEWVSRLRQEDLDYFTDGVIEGVGYRLLLVTMPLMLIQGVITLFPVLLLIIIHFLTFGLVEGFLISLIGTVGSSLLCYWIVKSFSGKWVENYWAKRQEKLNRLLHWMTEYGVLVIVILRSVPIMPSNLISIAAAFSPIPLKQYIWSSIWGNISMVWLLSILAAPIWMGEGMFFPYLIGYLIYALTVFVYYAIHYYRSQQTIQHRNEQRNKKLI
ncbi:VTT domain-containing protein [Evansella sp. AB-P1]|uniref:TVP38/TMEM64 family protein n=1 Tax=Evansella sp. AB-P1 TaxID=3037653 RepID=UPI00241D7427|nr:VTT domain-containing protein [Evansella sp. AB-P1]MDG5789928.1 VTT domain-containing protein [Evansella sp. AB-P1]